MIGRPQPNGKESWLADNTRVPHLLIQGTDGYMRVIGQGESFTGTLLEKFHPAA
jgi:hypothetical protein